MHTYHAAIDWRRQGAPCSDVRCRRVLKSMDAIDSWDDEAALNGALAIVVHTAYHLGGIRQARCTLR